ncbi:MAG: hypothetical protein ACLGSH_03960, partial [Acidobacteriota bacterium]
MIRRSFAALLFAAFALAALPALAQSASQWVLDQSSLSYQVVHPMHTVNGTSHAAKGKGICQGGVCNFLVAAPVKSFGTGDSNRDLHMIETVKGAEFPMVVLRAQFPQSELNQDWVHANLEVQFAGQTAHFSNVPFRRTQQGNQVRIQGTVPATCSDFNI